MSRAAASASSPSLRLHTLAEWQDLFALPREQLRATPLGQLLRRRYESRASEAQGELTDADADLLEERLDAYAALLQALPAEGFVASEPVVIVASPGRDRLFSQ